MSSPQAPLFDARAQTQRQARARRRQARAQPFLITRCVHDVSERLQDVSRQFERACLVGPYDWRAAILAEVPCEKHPNIFDYAPRLEDGPAHYDLILSLLDLQSMEDPAQWMRAMRARLAPDGMFLGAMIGGASLSGLRAALYALDTERFGAPQPRIHPMTVVRQTAPLLSHVGLALPVIDSDRFTVHYRALGTLISDLRDLGLTNTLHLRGRAFLDRGYAETLSAQLRSDADKPFPITWEIVWLTGWAPHESQQKPLKPGSAKTPLNAALRSIRDDKN